MKLHLFQIAALSFVVLAGQLVPALAGNGIVVSSFPADSGPGYKAHPDEAGAVGPQHIVDFDGLNFVVHDKATGQVLLTKSQKAFWASVQPVNTLILEPNDPRMLYDPLSGRWFAVANGTGKGVGHGNGFLAVSTSSDPTKPWKGLCMPMEPQDLGLKIGVDKNGFYVCFINHNLKDLSGAHDCYAIPKADVIARGGPESEVI